LNIQFETPELVVVGMQSDGKSSFIEALLGFQFNIVETSALLTREVLLVSPSNPVFVRATQISAHGGR